MGSRHGSRLDSAVLHILAQQCAEGGPVPPRHLARLLERQFQRTVHPRSIARALARRGEKAATALFAPDEQRARALLAAYEATRARALGQPGPSSCPPSVALVL